MTLDRTRNYFWIGATGTLMGYYAWPWWAWFAVVLLDSIILPYIHGFISAAWADYKESHK